MLRFGTIGSGWIVDEYIHGAKDSGLWELTAVYSRTAERAQAFAQKHGAPLWFTDLEEMAASPQIDAVYIASPNALHFEQCRLFLERGKHVLCEKPLCAQGDKVAQLQQLAQERGLVFLEAIMYLHLPQRKILEDALGQLGKLSLVKLDFCQRSSKLDSYLDGELPNIFNPQMATGGWMDLGIYCLYPAIMLFGVPDHVRAHARFLSTGADGSGCVTLQYPDKTVVLTYSKTAQGTIGSEIQGEDGVIRIPHISKLINMTLTPVGEQEMPLSGPQEKYLQMSYEAAAFRDFIEQPEQNKARYRYVSHLALNVSQVMKRAREEAGIYFE